MNDPFATAIDDLLAQACTPAVVRHVEHGGDWQPLWASLQASGFADALVPEHDGGGGLALGDLFGVFERCGWHALPLPLAQTVLARALLSAAGVGAPDRPAGPISFAAGWPYAGGLHCDLAPDAGAASHVIVEAAGEWRLLELSQASAQGAGFVLDRALDWPRAALDAAALDLPAAWRGIGVRALQACLYACLLAGAAGRVLDMSLAYANQRVQFGRAIGKFQAVQHHLAVMAEHVAAARAAAELGCLAPGAAPQRLHAAVAKARSSEAALEVARLAHQIHGAIGFTAEFDLQLYTRRLHAWRRAGGSERLWHTVLGEDLIAQPGDATLERVCSMLDPLPEASS